MNKNLSPNDPSAAHRRKAVAQRRVGKNAKCAGCGEARPEALIQKSDPMICARCQRVKQGKTEIDLHHVAGENNNPATVSISVNDHRAVLTVAQQDWPTKTLRNPDGSPLLTAAGCIRGFADMVVYLIDEFVHWIASMCERLDEILIEEWGPEWWVKTDIAKFSKGKPNENY